MRLPWTRRAVEAEAPPAGSRAARAARTSWFILSWLATLAVVAAMVAVIGFVTVPRVLGWHGVIVLSGSMEPTLKTGGIAFVEPAKPQDVKVNDVMTFRREGTQHTLITHRVIDIQHTENGLEFTTQGDANSSPDGVTVKEAQVVGTVNYFVPEIGNVVDKLHDRTNYYVFIGIPAALLILNELVSIAAEVRKARNKASATEAAAPLNGVWS
jgi:signal peptidase